MFAPCPHCGYLMALIATGDSAPRECPRCHGLIDPQATPPVRSVPSPAGAPMPRDHEPAPAPQHAATQSAPASERDRAAANDRGNAANVVTAAVADDAGASAMPTSAPAAAGTVEAGTAASDRPVPDARVPAIDMAAPVTPDAATAQPTTLSPAARTARAPAAPSPASPSFARRRRTAAPTRRSAWAWRAGVLLLAVLLGGQLVLAQVDTLAQDPQWRPWLARACGTGLCVLPPGRDAAAFDMVERSVHPLPGTGVLAVQARFRNASPWPQAWPHLQLVLSDAQGRPAAARTFAPRDYAGAAARRPIAPGQTVQAQLRVVEPQPATVAFAFDFR